MKNILSLRRKYCFINLGWLFWGGVIGLMSLLVSEYYLVLFFSLFFYVAWFNYNLRCPNCNHPALRKPLNISNNKVLKKITNKIPILIKVLKFPCFESAFWPIPKRCVKCGDSFD